MPTRRRSEKAEEPSKASPEWILAGRAFVRGRLQPVEVAIGDDGRIQSVGKIRTGAPRRDVGDAVILPAATDLHVHFREPGGSADMESIGTGTVEAALGGVTLAGEMPNTNPAVTDVDLLEEKAHRVTGRAAIDVLLYASPTRPRELERLARSAGAFKVYLSPTTGIPEGPTPETVGELLRRLAELDLPVAVHAEDPAGFRSEPPPRDPVDWNAARPRVAERRAVDRLLPPPPRLRLHVAHVTTADIAERLRTANVSFEATPHHLLLSDRSGRDARFKVNPPLRSEADRLALGKAFRRGEVPCLASDHAPHSLDSKALPFERAPSGMPGVETMLPLLLSEVRGGTLELSTLVAAACDRPARWLGQPLGRIAPGHRANLLVVDFRARTRLSGRALHAPCGWTAFEGRSAIFPREHYRDGRRIVENGEFVGGTEGRVVRPEFAQGVSGSSGQ
jgi:dihydroorotase